jgi:hypothetical protein
MRTHFPSSTKRFQKLHKHKLDFPQTLSHRPHLSNPLHCAMQGLPSGPTPTTSPSSVLLAPFPKPLLTSVDSVHTVSLQFLQPQFKRPSVLHESVSDPTFCLPSLLTTFQTTPYCSTPLPPSPNSNVCSPFLLQIGKQTLHFSLLHLPKLHATLQTPPLAPAPGLLILFQSTPCRMKFTQLHANYDATNPSRLHRRQLATVGPTSPTTPGTF